MMQNLVRTNLNLVMESILSSMGEVHNNLDRVWIVQRFNLPRELDKHFEKGLQFGLNCNYTGLDRILKSHPGSERRLNLLKEICKQDSASVT